MATVYGEDKKAGKKENESYAQRSAMGGDVIGKAWTYWDDSRGVEVYANPADDSAYFELLSGGGVRQVQGKMPADQASTPASTLFTQGYTGSNEDGNKQAIPGVKNEQISYTPVAGKEIARTGDTIKNPKTGVDEYANAGEVLIEYTDGSVERRKTNDPNTPGSTTPIGEFGRTPEELGITRKTEIKGGEGAEVTRAPMSASQALAAANTPESMDAVIQGEGLQSTTGFELIGKEYKAASGQMRTADPGYSFYQDVDTRKIVQRPEKLESLARPTTSPSVLAERQEETPSTSATDILSSYGVQVDSQEFITNPIGSVSDLYTNLLDKFGVGSARSAKEYYDSELKSLDSSYADEAAEIDKNPWLSEALRSKKQSVASEKYNREKSQLNARATLALNFENQQIAQTQWMIGITLQQANADRAFNMDQAQLAMHRADSDFSKRLQIANYGLNKEEMKERAKQFEASYGLDVAKLGEQQRQFDIGTQLDMARINKPSGGSRGGTVTERANSQIPQIQQLLAESRGQDGYVDPGAYVSVRSQVLLSPDEFDKRFGSLVNPRDRQNLSVAGFTTPTSSIKVQDVISAISSSDAIGLSRDQIRNDVFSKGFDPDDSSIKNAIDAQQERSGSNDGFWASVADKLSFWK